MLLDIQNLLTNKGGGEDLTVFIQFLKVGRCGLGGLWHPNSHLFHTLYGGLSKRISDLLPPAPYQDR